MTETTRVLDFASYSFDVAWFGFLHTLSVGACVCIPSDSARRDNLVATILKFEANYVFLTPSLGRYLDSQCAPTIKDLIMGGEGVGRGDMMGWSNDVRVRVAYGPAECTVMSNVAVFSAGQIPDLFHTGRRLGVSCWVVSCFNPDFLAPLGAVGELVLEGPLFGRGYLGDLERTAAAFTDNPAWLSRGGQAVVGSMVIIGRKDAQVKIRGQRVELEEVETHARRLLPHSESSVALAADVVNPQGQTPNMLVLFIAAAKKVDAAVRDHVLRGLAEALPVYMVPSAFVTLPTIPTTATGKFFADDRRNGLTQKKPLITAIEKQLHVIWAEILRLSPSDVGLEDNFLHIGGDSVSAMRLAGHAQERGLPLTVVMILQKPRLEEMAQAVADTLESRPVQPGVDEPKSQNRPKSVVAKLARSAARKLGLMEDKIVDILPSTEFQQHSIRCAALRPRAEWGFFAVFLSGVAPARLRKACMQLCETVEIFRTVFVPLDDTLEVHAVILRDLQPDIVVGDVGGPLDEATYSFCGETLSREFSPGQPTIGFAILHQPHEQKTRLVMSMSHAHYDGLSLSLIAETLAALYQERPLPRLVPFSHFVRESLLRKPAAYQYW
ncbi:nonribosomal peptide synthase [Colletotrichum tofieldiae]|nr:nonribosomal peptide synthase [Colletotrichum tofieldiae]